MRKLLFAALGVVVLGMASCAKDEPTPTTTPNPKTELELTVLDSTGAIVPSANVELYKSQADYDTRNTNNMVNGFHTTDSFGKCKISSLSAIQYWFYVEKNGMTNTDDVYTMTLTKDVLNKKVVHIK
jgi:hypothetical protein